jgi:hypothetical protein
MPLCVLWTDSPDSYHGKCFKRMGNSAMKRPRFGKLDWTLLRDNQSSKAQPTTELSENYSKSRSPMHDVILPCFPKSTSSRSMCSEASVARIEPWCAGPRAVKITTRSVQLSRAAAEHEKVRCSHVECARCLCQYRWLPQLLPFLPHTFMPPVMLFSEIHLTTCNVFV